MTRHWRLLRMAPLVVAAVIVYLFLLAPIASVILASFSEGQTSYFKFPPERYSLAIYGAIPVKYLQSLGVSFVVALMAALVATTIGAIAALGIVRGRLGGQEWFLAFFRLPLQVPFVVTGVVFLQFYYRIIDVTGVDLIGSIPGLVLAHVFMTVPYGVGAVAVVLMRAGPRLEEAAKSLGAGSWSTFRRVTLPLMKPGIFAGFFYAFIISFGDVPVAVFIANGPYTTLPVEIFQALQFDFEPAVLALSTVVVLLSAGMIIAAQRLIGFDLVMPSTGR